ncbi:unnamed protein product [Trichogramma brassicae]|uniref:Uncharacterized protein n=1 Tax=Trichogramma brassicae TaxID=86971 RepID=A0A6H5I561_9HYME|nr:unnamed protein product [Trichogramma brassicae]
MRFCSIAILHYVQRGESRACVKVEGAPHAHTMIDVKKARESMRAGARPTQLKTCIRKFLKPPRPEENTEVTLTVFAPSRGGRAYYIFDKLNPSARKYSPRTLRFSFYFSAAAAAATTIQMSIRNVSVITPSRARRDDHDDKDENGNIYIYEMYVYGKEDEGEKSCGYRATTPIRASRSTPSSPSASSGAETNNARFAVTLRQLAAYYANQPSHLFVVRMAQGLIHMGKVRDICDFSSRRLVHRSYLPFSFFLYKGTITLQPPKYSYKTLYHASLAGLLVVLVSLLDCNNLILGKNHYLMYCLALAMELRWLVTLNEDLKVNKHASNK